MIGGLVRVELQGTEQLRATLTTRPRVDVGSRYTRRELFRITRGDGLVLPETGASAELSLLQVKLRESSQQAQSDAILTSIGEPRLITPYNPPEVSRDGRGDDGSCLRLGETGGNGLPWVHDQLGCPSLRPAATGHPSWSMDGSWQAASLDGAGAGHQNELTERQAGPVLVFPAPGSAARLARYYYGDYGPHGAELLQLSWGALEPQGQH